MKVIGMLGGMSPESTRVYYDRINEDVRRYLGGDHSAKIILYSLDFAPIKELAHQGKWEDLAFELIEGAKRVENAGADFLLFCTNTVHKVAEQVEQTLRVPLLHIVDVTAAEAKRHEVTCLGLLGTRFTMEEAFYVDRLRSQHGLETIVPDKPHRDLVHNMIYEELCHGHISAESQRQCAEIVDCLIHRGADGVILGCTELSYLKPAIDLSVPILDTTELHAKAAARFALDRDIRNFESDQSGKAYAGPSGLP